MKKLVLLTIVSFSFFFPSFCCGQGAPIQIIKGQVLDDVSHSPLAGATIQLRNDSLITTMSDAQGRFTLTAVPVGRRTLIITYTGYQPQVLSEILVTSGAEVELNVALTEQVQRLQEVIVKGTSRRVLNNEMVAVSGRTFRAEETSRYAGALGDPSRMVAGFAGVSSANDSRNDIVVRGNSPSGVLWQLEGMDIPNPNHYGSLNSTGGPVSLLNTNNLAKSDFLTGAFPAQYGNGLSSVFDLRLKNGNTDKAQYLASIGFTGFELGADGPISKKSGSSYIVNYRYSTLGVFHAVGLNFGTGESVPQYQDLTFHLRFPISSKSTLSIFGLGGPSQITFLGADADKEDLYGAANQNLYTKYATGIAGLTLETHFQERTFGQLTIGVAGTLEKVQQDSLGQNNGQVFARSDHRYTTGRVSINYRLNHKWDRKNSLVIGTNNTLFTENLFDRRFYEAGTIEKINLNENAHLLLVQGYAQVKHRFSEPLSLNLGMHAQALTLHPAFSLEPRLGLQYVTREKNILALGYAWVTQMQSPLVYFYQTSSSQGSFYTNRDLGFTRSQQLVGSYDYHLSARMHLKTEVYYQYIDRVPVEQRATSFSMLNQGAGFSDQQKDSLVNEGRGRNVGTEFTLEHYLVKGTYFLVTASLFDSKYQGSDRIWHNTAFNTHYALNVVAGKEMTVGGGKNTISFNIKASTVGGRYMSPVDQTASEAQQTTVYDETTAPYSLRLPAYFRTDLKIGYRSNRARSTLEFGIDLENITGHKNVLIQSYSISSGRVVSQYQQGFLPVPYLRWTF
ncbi:MAG: TonB-dependent receptor [Flavisolibacter sp.]